MDDKNSDEIEKIKISDNETNKEQVSSNDTSSQSVTIKGRDVIKITPYSQERIFNSIEGTAEEEGHFTWRPEEKEVDNHLFSPANNDLNKTQRKKMPTRSARVRSTRRTSKDKIKRKYPRHFYIIFYGIPILIILILGILVIKRYQGLQTQSPRKDKKTKEERSWSNAERKYRQADIQFGYAKEFSESNDSPNALIYLRKSLKLYKVAISLGQAVINKQVKLEMKRQNLGLSDARKYVTNENGFNYILRPLRRWKKTKKKIEKMIEENK